MKIEGFKIENFEPLANEVIVKINSFVENEVKVGDTTLIIATDTKGYVEDVREEEMGAIIESMKKSKFKDKKAHQELVRMMAEKTVEKEDLEDTVASHITRHGTVTKLPVRQGNFGNWDFYCELDLSEGDEIWFDPHYTRQQRDANIQGKNEIDDKTLEDEHNKFILVPSQAIYAKKVEDKIVSINGYFLGKKLPNDRFAGKIVLPDSGIAKVEITHCPKSLPIYQREDVWKNTELKVGDIVYVMNYFATPLDSTLGATTDLVRFQSRIVLAIEQP